MREEMLSAFLDELQKIAEYAPGIPAKRSHELPTVTKPTVWEFGIHDHDAKRRGRHFDLRLGDPKSGRAHSWALPPTMPKPGESLWAIQQPTHTVRYMDFEGTLPEGYGAGGVSLHARSRTDLLHATPGHVVFQLHDSKGTQEYVLHQVDKEKWRLINRTPTQEKLKLPLEKTTYKEKSPDKVQLDDPRYLMTAKIDDAHNLFVFHDSGAPVRVFSYRPSKKSPTGLIEHTAKIESLHGKEVPAGLGGTVLRGGIYAEDPSTGKAIDAHVIGGLLNSDVWKSREKQRSAGKLIPILYDVEKYRGRDVSKAPYKEKLRILTEVAKKMPAFALPPMAHGEEEKKALLAKIEAGKLPITSEGVVLQRLDAHEVPIKAKFREDQDVFVRGFFPAEKGSKYEGKAVGGFTFSHTPHGPVVGRVGTGLSDALRRAMHSDPKRFHGAVAVVSGARTAPGKSQFSSGAVRAPSFTGFHADKNADRNLLP